MLLASCVAALGVALLWVGPEPMWEHRCPLTLDLTMPEGTGLHVSSSWWPPGTECEYTFPDGTTTNSTYVPWAEWLIMLALAAALGAIASRLLPVGARPSPTFALSVVALTIGLGAVFAGPVVGVMLLVMAFISASWLRLRHDGVHAQRP